MEIGIACDLRADFVPEPGRPDDQLEEYDSEATLQGLQVAIESHGHGVRRIGGGRRFLLEVLERPPELVFNIAEGRGTRSREAHVPAVCEMLGIPITHSDPLTLAASLDKAVAKRLVAARGVPTAPFAVIENGTVEAALGLSFPVFAKPLFEGSSMGVRKSSKLRTADELRARCAGLRSDYAQPVLVEEFLGGPEFTVAVLGTGATARVLGIMEIVPKKVPPAEFVYSLEVKRDWIDEVAYHVPPKRPEAFNQAVADVALAAYRALECRDIARVDIRCDAAGTPHFMEVNPLPGLNHETGDIVILARLAGTSYRDLVGAVIDGARSRYGL